MSGGPSAAARFGALLGKELGGLFGQPLLYVVGTFFLLLSGYYFYTDLVFFVTFGFGENIFENFFQLLFVDLRLVLLLSVPLLTMRTIAEERKLGTIELLFTYPVRDVEILLAKLVACALAALALLSVTIVPLAYLHRLEPFPLAPIAVGYVGLGLMAVSFAAWGLLFSSLTDNQVVAAMSTLGTLLLLWILSWNEPSPDAGPVAWLGRLSMFDHFESFARGVVDTEDLVYFASLVLFASAASLQVLGARAWRGNRLLPTLVGLAGLLVALAAIDVLAERHNQRLDFTPQKRFTLSPHARRIVEGLPRDVEVVAFLRSGNPANAAVIDLVERIAAASPRVGLRVVDVNRNPSLARHYGVDAYGAVVVASEAGRRVFSSAREELLVGAMVELTREAPRTIAFFSDGEPAADARGAPGRAPAFATLRRALADEGSLVVPFDLGPAKADRPSVVLVAGGQGKFTDEVRERFDEWLERGVGFVVLLERGFDPALGAWLRSHAIEPSSDVVLDPENRLHGGEAVSLEARPAGAADGGATGSERAVVDTLDHGVLLSFAGSLRRGAGAAALLESSAQSWSTRNLPRAEQGFAAFEPGLDTRGPLVVAAAVPEGKSGARDRRGRLVVVGDADFASDGFIEFLSNRDFVMNAVAWAARDDDLIALRARKKEMGRHQFFLSAGQARTALFLAAGLLPGASALAGCALALRRRLRR